MREEASSPSCPSCRVLLFGRLCVEQQGRVVARFRTQRAAVLLGFLAFYHDRTHSRDALMEMLWPGVDPDAGRKRFKQELSSLRRQIEPPGVPRGSVLITEGRERVGLHPALVTTDVAQFEAALRAAYRQPDGSTERRALLDRAADLYAGELLPGQDADWVTGERRRLEEAGLGALRALAAESRSADPHRAADYLRRAISIDPHADELRLDLMRLYLDTGQPAKVREQMNEWKRFLRKGSPGEELPDEARALARRAERDLSSTQNAKPFDNVREPLAASASAAPERTGTPPRGTVTLLLTDIQGSTPLMQKHPEPYRSALKTHHDLLRRAFDAHDGYVFKEVGDAFHVAFARPGDALRCAVAIQRDLAQTDWPFPDDTPLRVRIALHTGELEPDATGDYHDFTVNRAARVRDVAHGAQILLSETTQLLIPQHEWAAQNLQPNDLGIFRLRDITEPEPLFQISYPGMPPEPFPPPSANRLFEGSLPPVPTPFFGRDAEIETLADRLRPARPGPLLTLTGIGGAGKTRLALRVAERLHAAYSGAVWFVPLVDVAEPGRVLDAVHQALRLKRLPDADPRGQIAALLRDQPALLVLDNFEHLLTDEDEAALDVLRDLRARAPQIACLITSRQPLGIEGEREFPLPTLPVPHASDPGRPPDLEALAQLPSVQLFVERAQAIRPDFQITPRNAAAIAELVCRLEGIPLALVLAATWAQTLTPAQMLQCLERRFALLETTHKGLPLRHRKLLATIEGSFDALRPELQRFFAQLSVFRGGWTLDAAEVVCQEPAASEFLRHLQERSLILAEESGEEMRFRLLETLREFAQQQLSDEEFRALRQCHLRHFLSVAEQAEPELQGQQQAVWFDRLEAEHENFRAALHTALNDEEDSLMALRMATALHRFWYVRGHLKEGRQWLEFALTSSGNGDRQKALRARALNAVGVLAWRQVDYNAARTFYSESLALRHDLDDDEGIAACLNNLAILESIQENFEQAQSLFEESLDYWYRVNNKAMIAKVLANLGGIALDQGGFDKAYPLLIKSLFFAREVGDKQGEASTLANLGQIAFEKEDYVTARNNLLASLAILRELKDEGLCALRLLRLGMVAAAQKEYERAAHLSGAAHHLYPELAASLHFQERNRLDALIEVARTHLGETKWQVEWGNGYNMTLDQAAVIAEHYLNFGGGAKNAK